MNDPKVEKQKPVPPFVQFCCAAIPQVFDDSLSYYEALCAMWKYLDETVKVINNNALITEDFIAKVNELHNYVENYFNNLDVQEEINNKLDQMALDGTLQEIITTYIQSNVAWTFDTVADMKLAENLIAGSYAQTLGFHTINDGGGAIYKISDTGTANEMDVIAVGDLFANLTVINSYVTAEQFGAYGDNTNDDITVLQAFINYCYTNGYTAHCPKKYKTSYPLTIQDKNYFDVDIYYLNYTGNTNAVELITSKYCNLNIETLITNYDGLFIQANRTGYKTVAYNNINIDLIVAQHNGIVLDSNNYGISYNKFTLKQIQATNNCINATRSSEDLGWISENYFYGGHLRGIDEDKCNICVNLLNCQTLKFYNTGIEGCDYGFVIDNCNTIVVDMPRMQESITYYGLQLKNTVHRSVFNFATTYLQYLDWSLLTAGFSNIFTGTFRSSAGNPQYFTYFEIWGDGMHNCNQKGILYKNGRNADTTLSLGSHIRGLPSIIYVNDNTLTLDDKYYNPYNINEIYLLVDYTTTANSVVKNSNGDVIFDFSTYNRKKLKLTAISDNLNNISHYGWLVEEVTLL